MTQAYIVVDLIEQRDGEYNFCNVKVFVGEKAEERAHTLCITMNDNQNEGHRFDVMSVCCELV